jgi:hypothetical protein
MSSKGPCRIPTTFDRREASVGRRGWCTMRRSLGHFNRCWTIWHCPPVGSSYGASVGRRQFLSSGLVLGSGVLAGRAARSSTIERASSTCAAGSDLGAIEHVVFLMQGIQWTVQCRTVCLGGPWRRPTGDHSPSIVARFWTEDHSATRCPTTTEVDDIGRASSSRTAVLNRDVRLVGCPGLGFHGREPGHAARKV